MRMRMADYRVAALPSPGRRKDQGSMMVYPGLVGICGTQRTQLSSMATRVVKVHEREWEVEGGEMMASCSSWKLRRR